MRHDLGRVQQIAEQLALFPEDFRQDRIAAILLDFADTGHRITSRAQCWTGFQPAFWHLAGMPARCRRS